MNGMAPLPPGRSRFEQLVAALRRKDPRLNQYAAEILRLVGKPVVHFRLGYVAKMDERPQGV